MNREDFVNLNRSGTRHHTRHFAVTIKHNGLSITRLGVTVSKKVGNAVQRNRTKRLIRECFRLSASQIPQGYDIVVAAKKDASYLDFWKAKAELEEVFFKREPRA